MNNMKFIFSTRTSTAKLSFFFYNNNNDKILQTEESTDTDIPKIHNL